ncbi:sugar-binding transcriptional regulator [Streptomyces armeniacus]|uniref:Sugar-binding transcriptional regulator n=1 Tax=Streptomyces armeniacus TaxID=83291 RepID=A0A345XM50_9ACTN|nr:sugar-binding domain-containing protein [Streptomyces armeniacus]AXK32716.1 sugar-binding transcriptional regulator [Streptomyces armeniacus]
MHPTEDEALLYQVASMYYEQELTQEQIGETLHFTRWKVGRLLADARKAGLVRIQVVHPKSRVRGLEERLQDATGLRDAVVVARGRTEDEEELRARVAEAGADYLARLSPSPRLLGVSWGRTMDLLARSLSSGWAHGVHVVQINGGLTRSHTPSSAQDLASRIAHLGEGTLSVLPAPSIVEQETTRRALEQDSAVGDVLAQAAEADTVLFSPGAIGSDSVLVGSGYLGAGELKELADAGAVGDVVGRFIDARGGIVDKRLDDRTLGLPLDALRSRPVSVAVVSGTAKHAVCAAVVSSGLCNTLVTDDHTASHLLDPASCDELRAGRGRA